MERCQGRKCEFSDVPQPEEGRFGSPESLNRAPPNTSINLSNSDAPFVLLRTKNRMIPGYTGGVFRKADANRKHSKPASVGQGQSCNALHLARIMLFSACSTRLMAQTAQPQIGYQADPKADQKKTLLLKDFKPVSMLHAPEHPIEKAKFYVIDVHSHVNDAARIDEHMPPARVIEVMNATNVRTIVILTGMWGDKLQGVIDEMVKPYPGRFMVFTQLDWSRVDDPNFGNEMVALLRDSVSRGARGLKLLKDFGLGVRDKNRQAHRYRRSPFRSGLGRVRPIGNSGLYSHGRSRGILPS